MSSIRTTLSYAVLTLLTLGYLASQWAALNGTAPTYAAMVDTPSIKWLSLAVFLSALVLMVIPDREEERE